MARDGVPLRAGVARVLITPPIGATLTGFPHPARQATHERDPLYATALVIDDGQERAALICCDLQCLHPALVAAVRARVQATTAIASDHVMICCSHTHSGPVCYDHPQARPIDRAYVATLPFTLAGAVAMAAARVVPVALRWGTASADVGVNRRERRPDGRIVLGHNPAGPVDRTVRVACLDRNTGQGAGNRTLAVLVNYSCHPVVLGAESTAISADYVGSMRRVVEQAVDAPVLFVQGACGDINPRLGPAADAGQVETLGLELAGAILTGYATAQAIAADDAGAIVAAVRQIALPLLDDASGIPDFPSEAERAARAEGLDQTEPWAIDLGTDRASGRQETPIELQMLQLGGLRVVGIPAEPFVEIGLALQQARRGPTIVAGYTGGCVGYVPMPDAYALGGYEVSHSIVYSRLPAPLAPECARRIIEEGTRLLTLRHPCARDVSERTRARHGQ